jgi:hypothetical protein
MSADSFAWRPGRRVGRVAARLRPAGLLARPELLGLIGLSAVLNLWNLSINGWANTYYSAAVRSMSASWHDFLFAALDPTGLMTVDKPPLSLWIQALSARAFGFHPLSLLVPQALMGIVAVVLVYDLVRRFFGRAAGFAAGVVLATTPVVVAVSRHNNRDARATGRPHPVAGAERRRRRAGVRGQDGRGAVRGAGDRAGMDLEPGVERAGAARTVAQVRAAALGRRRDVAGRRGLAAAGDAHPGQRQALDLGHF